MAITYDSSKAMYTGLSTDDKTFLQVSGMNGVKIYYTDVPKIQIYDVNAGWVDYVEHNIINNITASNTTNNLIIYRYLSLATTNLTSLKVGASKLYSLKVSNLNTTTARYLKLYNKASAPVLATDVPIITIPIASNTINPIEIVPNNLGIYFSNGIAFAITGALADTDTTVIVVNDVVINAMYV